MTAGSYTPGFFDRIAAGAARSAAAVLPLVTERVAVRSVLDIGCGAGVWLAEWRRLGVEDVFGVDGDYVRPEALAIPRDRYFGADLTKPLALGRRFDLVQCLEVAEHLPPAAADTLVDTIAAHGDAVLFSAAVPGQGGTHHFNERPHRYWIRRFEARGFAAWDVLRPKLRDDRMVERWYRYNAILFTRTPPAGVTAADAYPARGYRTPLSWRVRNAVLRVVWPNVLREPIERWIWREG